MKIKTSDLIGPALDWAVANAAGVKAAPSPWMRYPNTPKQEIVGWSVYLDPPQRNEFGMVPYEPSADWAQGGPLIEQEGIELSALLGVGNRKPFRGWFAGRSVDSMDLYSHEAEGPTPLIAAMRCFVASKLGSEVEIPEELL